MRIQIFFRIRIQLFDDQKLYNSTVEKNSTFFFIEMAVYRNYPASMKNLQPTGEAPNPQKKASNTLINIFLTFFLL
jgi:hypothetical protein